MKTPEDEAFDDLVCKQGAWGGGFTAKRQAAMDKINSDFDEEYKKMHEDLIKYGTSWSQDGKRIDPMSVYKEQPAPGYCKNCKDYTIEEPLYAQPAQGPFGWYSAQEDEFMTDKIRKEHERLNSYTHINGKFDLALYAAPPKREWVGLTDEELADCLDMSIQKTCRAIESKLKEKNS